MTSATDFDSMGEGHILWQKEPKYYFHRALAEVKGLYSGIKTS